jgi:uncharacterized membrane protein
MGRQNVTRPGENVEALAPPSLRAIGWSDVRSALRAGMEDFRATPAFGLVFGTVFALGGLLILACLFWLRLAYVAYPLCAGFALVGPFAAAGLYEVSRRREQHLRVAWPDVLETIWRQTGRQLAWLSFVGVFILVVWMYQVRLLLVLFLGFTLPPTLPGFIHLVFTTPEGVMFLVVGHGVGAALALVSFALTAVSCPLLLDRNYDFITAMITSVQAILQNPGPMLGWAAIVAVLLVIGMAPLLLGLPIVLPTLGHATWHLYRRLVVLPEP